MVNREILKESDKVAFQQTEQSDGIHEKLAREAYVLLAAPVTGAIKNGYKSITEHPGETGLAVAASVGIGIGLGYFSRGAGLGGLVARGAGAAFGVQFARELASPTRWGEVRDILGDTWNNKQNFDRNVAGMENTTGRFVFDTSLMLAGGVAGAKIGQGLQGKVSMFRAESGLPMSARLAEVTPGEVSGRRFRADIKAGEATPWEVAEGIVKSKKSYGWGEIAELQRSMLVAKDAVALEHKGRIESITREGATLKGEVSKLNGELTSARTQLKEGQNLAAENAAVQKATREVDALKAKRQELPAKEAELAVLDQQIAAQAKAKADAKKHGRHEGEGGKKDKGADKGGEKAEKGGDAQPVDIKGRAKELREEIGRIKNDTNDAIADSAINRARVRQSESESALQTATEGQPARVEALDARVKELEGSVAERQTAHDGLGTQLKDAIKAYEGRVGELMADNSKLVETKDAGASTQATTKGDRGTREAKRDRAGTGSGDRAGGTDRAQAQRPEVKREAVVEKPVEVAKTAEVVAQERADVALRTAKESVLERQQKEELGRSASRAKKEALDERAAIESGKRTFESPEAREAALEQTRVKEQGAAADLKKVGKIQYFRPLNNVNDYAKAAEGYLAAETNAAKRDVFVKEAVRNIEEMMSTIPNSFKGQGSEKGIASQSRGMTPEKRLAQLREHLDSRLGKMNAEHEAKVKRSTEVPAVQEAFGKISSGHVRESLGALAESTINPRIPAAQRTQIVDQATQALYENSTIAFFERGKLVQNRGSDGQLHQQLFDAAKVERGQGRLDRLEGHTPEGYALVVPKLRSDGKLMELGQRRSSAPRPGARPGSDRPTYAKEVLEVGGTVPEGVGKGTSFGEILKNFKGEPVKATAYEAVAPKAEPVTVTEAAKPVETANGNVPVEVAKVEAPVETAKVEAPVETAKVEAPVETVKIEAPGGAVNANAPVEPTTGDAIIGKVETAPETGT